MFIKCAFYGGKLEMIWGYSLLYYKIYQYMYIQEEALQRVLSSETYNSMQTQNKVAVVPL